MKRMIMVMTAVACLIGCADPAFQQYTANRQASINGMRNGQEKFYAQQMLDQQVLADKQRQNQQAAAVALTALGVAAGVANAYPYGGYYRPYYRPWRCW